MTRFRGSPTSRLFIALVVAGVFLGGALAFTVMDGPGNTALSFPRDRGLSVQSMNEPDDPFGALILIEDLSDIEGLGEQADQTVTGLEAFARYTLTEYGKADLSLAGGLVQVKTDASQPEQTYIQIADTGIYVDEVLRTVPDVDAIELLRSLSENGTQLIPDLDELVPDDGGGEEPPEDPLDLIRDIHVYHAEGPLNVTLAILPFEQRAQLIVKPGETDDSTATVGGLPEINIAASPMMSVRYGDKANDTVYDLQLWNPIERLSIGPSSLIAPTKTLDCTRQRVNPSGTPVNTWVDPCRTLIEAGVIACKDATAKPRYCQQIEVGGTIQSFEGVTPVAERGKLLHLTSTDLPEPAITIGVQGEEPVSLRGPAWSGDPFTDEGVTFGHREGSTSRVQVFLPTPERRSIGYRIQGPLVDPLRDRAEYDSGGSDLSVLDSELQLGPYPVSTDAAYRMIGLASGFMSQVWRDSDGEIRDLRVNSLLGTNELFRIARSANDTVTVWVASVDGNVTYAGAQIAEETDPLVTGLGSILSDTSAFATYVVDTTNDRVVAVVDFVDGAVGCALQLEGCLGVDIHQYVPKAGQPGYNDPRYRSPPQAPSVSFGSEHVDSVESLRVWFNAAAGWALAVAPKATTPGVTGCLPALSGQVLTCDPYTVDALATDTYLAASVGILTEGADAAFTLLKENRPPDVVVILDGEEILRVGGGAIRVLGVGATVGGEDALITITRPGEEPVVIGPTFPGDVLPLPFEDPLPSDDDLPIGISDLDDLPPSKPPSLDMLPGADEGVTTIQQGVRFERDPYGDLTGVSIQAPGPDDMLFRYHDDGETVTITSGFDSVLDAQSFPSPNVQIVGDPIAGRMWYINAAGSHSANQSGQTAKIAFAGKIFEEKTGTAFPDYSLLYTLAPAPTSSIALRSGPTYLSSEAGELGDNASKALHFVSGLRPVTFDVTAVMEGEQPLRLGLFGFTKTDPSYTAGHRFNAPLVGWDEATRTATYRGVLGPAVTRDLAEGDVLRFALAWSERHGPVQAIVIDDAGSGHGYGYKVDTRAPTATLSALPESAGVTFPVSWSAPADAGSGIVQYTVQQTQKTAPSDADWAPWVAAMPVSDGTAATFTGEPGQRYAFRARACDGVANCGDWSATKAVRIAAAAKPVGGEGTEGTAPTVAFTKPVEGEAVAGIYAVAWTATHPDIADLLVNLEYRADTEAFWTPLYSGLMHAYAWDTTTLPDGAYHLRATATYGAKSAETERAIEVSNGLLPPSLDEFLDAQVRETPIADPAGPPAEPGEDDAGKDKKKDSPGPAPLAVIGLLVVVAVALRRRR